VPANSSIPDQWGAKSTLAAIIQTASISEAERSAYCREHGLYPEQLDAWRASVELADAVKRARASEVPTRTSDSL